MYSIIVSNAYRFFYPLYLEHSYTITYYCETPLDTYDLNWRFYLVLCAHAFSHSHSLIFCRFSSFLCSIIMCIVQPAASYWLHDVSYSRLLWVKQLYRQYCSCLDKGSSIKLQNGRIQGESEDVGKSVAGIVAIIFRLKSSGNTPRNTNVIKNIQDTSCPRQRKNNFLTINLESIHQLSAIVLVILRAEEKWSK